MPTLDELRLQKQKIAAEVRRGLRPNSRPTHLFAGNGRMCKDCIFAVSSIYARTYYKCELNREKWTHSSTTDIRLRDPACRLFEPK